MKKSKTIRLAALVVCLAAAGLWLCWECPMTMNTLIPEEIWTGVELHYGVASGDGYDMEFESPELDWILPQMGAVRLSRAERHTYLDDQYFQIVLYNGETYPTVIYVGNTGRVQIAQHMDFDNWKDYEGGEAFFRYLESYSKNLSAAIKIPQ